MFTERSDTNNFIMDVKVLLVIVVVFETAFSMQSSCLTPNGETASCIGLFQCSPIQQLLTNQDEILQKFIEESSCGNFKVCCGQHGNYTTLPTTYITKTDNDSMNYPELWDDLSSTSICGLEQMPSFKIKGGEAADFEEFPWMAALEYVNILSDDPSAAGIRCGGAIISDRYILTAAHCVISREFLVVRAWLGATNISSDANCLFDNNGIENCINSTQKFAITKRIPHRNYDRLHGHDDIGLLLVEKNIVFTDYIRPICLPSPYLSPPNNRAIVTIAGWGSTENGTQSEVKLKVNLAILSKNICSEKLQTEITSRQVCAGSEQNKDACEGDSGGPLMRNFLNRNEKIQWYQEGIVSYGYDCAHFGHPGIYTRVAEYITWIKENTSDQLMLEINAPCVTPNRENATCVPVLSCTVIYDAVKKKTREAIDFARKSKCGVYENKILVCCGSTGFPKIADTFDIEAFIDFGTTEIPDRAVCGLVAEKTTIFEFELTQIGEFPWLAALEYESKFNHSDVGVKCGGSIINKRYVLTAANCILLAEYKITKVRLGEWRLSTDPDCVVEEETASTKCADPVQIFTIHETIIHPFYNRSNYDNDVALIRLDGEITYTDFIRPICLPPLNLPPPSFDSFINLAGWGFKQNSERSDIKKKADLQVFPNNVCKEKLNKTVKPNQLCFGEVTGDTCQGDSGGAIMRTYEDPKTQRSNWYLDGVIGYYNLDCAKTGLPNIYNRVSRYLNWIINTVAEQ